ncbi:MAG TPA: hypothetical protein VGO49_22480 [Bradyrhizobium sp.]|jgi:hypothetical protein|nr:hypothetical protein [Bradyrhizobium sp.]
MAGICGRNGGKSIPNTTRAREDLTPQNQDTGRSGNFRRSSSKRDVKSLFTETTKAANRGGNEAAS